MPDLSIIKYAFIVVFVLVLIFRSFPRKGKPVSGRRTFIDMLILIGVSMVFHFGSRTPNQPSPSLFDKKDQAMFRLWKVAKDPSASTTDLNSTLIEAEAVALKNPKDSELQNTIGQLQHRLGKHDAAIKTQLNLVRKDGNDTFGTQLARFLLAANAFEKPDKIGQLLLKAKSEGNNEHNLELTVELTNASKSSYTVYVPFTAYRDAFVGLSAICIGPNAPKRLTQQFELTGRVGTGFPARMVEAKKIYIDPAPCEAGTSGFTPKIYQADWNVMRLP